MHTALVEFEVLLEDDVLDCASVVSLPSASSSSSSSSSPQRSGIAASESSHGQKTSFHTVSDCPRDFPPFVDGLLTNVRAVHVFSFAGWQLPWQKQPPLRGGGGRCQLGRLKCPLKITILGAGAHP